MPPLLKRAEHRRPPLRWAARWRIALILLLAVAPLAAQEASSFLPLDHWAIPALRRLDGLGLLPPGFDPGTRSLPIREAAMSFQRAVETAPPELASLARGYLERFEMETGSLAAGPTVSGAAELGYTARQGALEPGTGGWDIDDWSGPHPRPDVAAPYGRVEVSALTGTWLAGGGTAESVGSDLSLQAAYLVVAVGPVLAWGGRRPVGFRPGTGGGVVLDSVTVDGGGVALGRPLTVPLLGAIRFETALSRVDDNGWVGRPWLWSMRGSIRPHERLGLGITRGMMFGGDGGEPVTFQNLLYMLIGKHGGSGSGFENQIAAADLWYRPPLPVPTVLRVEWGFDDSAGAWKDQPAIVAGLDVPAVPGFPALGLGVEYTYIAPRTERHPSWYRHWWFHDGWAAYGSPLAHPLGGHGSEWLFHGELHVPGSRLRVRGQALLRERGAENLFAPDREGKSRGMVLDADWRMTTRLETTVGVSWEEGQNAWRRTAVQLGARWLLPGVTSSGQPGSP